MLLAPDGGPRDYFGWSVAIYGDFIVVGAWYDGDNGFNSGSAHVFVQGGEEWTHQAKLLAPDGAAGDEFGNGVAIHRNSVVVGAYRDDDNGNESGSAHTFVGQDLESVTAFVATRKSGSCRRWTAELVAGDGVWAAEALGEAPVPGNERKVGPPADRAAPRPLTLANHVVVLGMTHRTAGETPPPPPGLVAQSGAGQGARTAARDAVLLAVQEAAEASAAQGRAPGGARLPGDVPGRATSAMTVTRAHPRANARY
ncbi:hypothetical protein THAOC_12292 [Thalassiosira oceanica]|uniref:Uncharacterized protein n=1 Tax=Thalassiosira oceanica TaxID=159749 RepID=K0SN31_THAOC|nr:hypothetical protein THAOC_12292 [Thalassiosira oceanica]|eukprot:EJK66755.1 hypothetical protein THAOC_12292 [Thalassiosira oceanica]